MATQQHSSTQFRAPVVMMIAAFIGALPIVTFLLVSPQVTL